MFDTLITEFDKGLRTLFAPAQSQRPRPDTGLAEAELSAEEKRHAAGLMRVNHCGEVCAQALYQGQALTARNLAAREALQQAAFEEVDADLFPFELAELVDQVLLMFIFRVVE